MNFRVLLLFGLLLTTSMAYPSCSWRQSSVLGWLKNVDDQIPLQQRLSKPTWKMCQPEWSAKGACCDEDVLGQSEESIGTMAIGQDSKFRDVLYDCIRKHSYTSNMCLESDEVKAAISTQAQETQGKCLKGLSEESAYSAIEYSHSMDKGLFNYHKDKAQCFIKEAEVRESAICDSCAFDNNRRLLYGFAKNLRLPEDKCNGLLDSCNNTWRFMLDTSLMRYFADMVNTEGEIDDSAIDIFTGTNLKSLKTAFDACVTGSTGSPSECHQYHKNLICHSYINRVFPTQDDEKEGYHGNYKNPKFCKCKWRKRCKMYTLSFGHKTFRFKKCHWKCIKDDDGGNGGGDPEPGTGNTDQGTVCGCPKCDEFNFDPDSGDFHSRTVQSENLNCTTMDMYTDNFISIQYTFITPYANNMPLNNLQTVQCVRQDSVDPRYEWNFEAFVRLNAELDPNVHVNQTTFNLNPTSCDVFGQIIRDTNQGDGTFLRETFTFEYNPSTTPFTTFENFPSEVTTTEIIPAYEF